MGRILAENNLPDRDVSVNQSQKCPGGAEHSQTK